MHSCHQNPWRLVNPIDCSSVLHACAYDWFLLFVWDKVSLLSQADLEPTLWHRLSSCRSLQVLPLWACIFILSSRTSLISNPGSVQSGFKVGSSFQNHVCAVKAGMNTPVSSQPMSWGSSPKNCKGRYEWPLKRILMTYWQQHLPGTWT